MNPTVWPQNNKLPPVVAYPIGKAAWEPKSKIVVKKGKRLKPAKTAPKYITQIYLASNPIQRIIREMKPNTINILHFILYLSL